jgi:glycosyltransferase 2 family protein
MKIVRALFLIGGIAALAYLIAQVGPEPLLASLGHLTWWQFLLICLPYGAVMAVDTLGWLYAFPGNPASFGRMFAARTAGEAVNVVTAVGGVGGEAVKVWLLRPAVSYEESVPSVVIAKTTITIAQALFLVLGLVLAAFVIDFGGPIVTAMLGLLVIEILAVGGFFAAQVTGVVGRAGRLLAWAGLIKERSYAERLDASLREYYAHQWWRFVASVAAHLAGWLLGVVETFITMWALEVPVTAATATVIEALGSAVRFATFLVPGSLGTLEGANAAAFEALGLGASAGLTFSLVRRGRQVVWIVVGLLVLVAARVQATFVNAAPPGPAR